MKLLRMTRLLRILRIRQVVDHLEEMITSQGLALAFILVKFLLLLTVVAHWTA
jgi:hypothetical protein